MGDEQIKRMDWFTPAMIVPVVLALFGAVATVSSIILHLTVRTAVTKLENKMNVQDADVKLTLEQLKTKLAERESERYREFVIEMRSQYADKALSDQKHKENSGALASLSEWQKSFERQFSQFRSDLDHRLTSIEERLPLS